MDVIHCSDANKEYNDKIDKMEAGTDTCTDIDELEKEILKNDFGGYYGARRDLIDRLDALRMKLGIAIPYREESVWTRPAAYDDTVEKMEAGNDTCIVMGEENDLGGQNVCKHPEVQLCCIIT